MSSPAVINSARYELLSSYRVTNCKRIKQGRVEKPKSGAMARYSLCEQVIALVRETIRGELDVEIQNSHGDGGDGDDGNGNGNSNGDGYGYGNGDDGNGDGDSAI